MKRIKTLVIRICYHVFLTILFPLQAYHYYRRHALGEAALYAAASVASAGLIVYYRSLIPQQGVETSSEHPVI